MPPRRRVSVGEVSSLGLPSTFRGILRFAPPRSIPAFFMGLLGACSPRLSPLQHIPDSAVYVSPRVCLTRFVPLSGFLPALLAVCSCRTLWALFQTQAFVGFPSSELCSLQGSSPLSGFVALLPFTGRPRPRCDFRALLSLKSSSRLRRYSQRVGSRCSPEVYASLRLSLSHPHHPFQSGFSLVLRASARYDGALYFRVCLVRARFDL